MLTWRGGVGGQLPRNINWSLVFRSAHAVVTAVAFSFLNLPVVHHGNFTFYSLLQITDNPAWQTTPQRHSLPVSMGRAHLHWGEFVLTGKWCSRELRFTSIDVVLKFYQVFFFKDYQYFLSFYWIWMTEMANHIC